MFGVVGASVDICPKHFYVLIRLIWVIVILPYKSYKHT